MVSLVLVFANRCTRTLLKQNEKSLLLMPFAVRLAAPLDFVSNREHLCFLWKKDICNSACFDVCSTRPPRYSYCTVVAPSLHLEFPHRYSPSLAVFCRFLLLNLSEYESYILIG